MTLSCVRLVLANKNVRDSPASLEAANSHKLPVERATQQGTSWPLGPEHGLNMTASEKWRPSILCPQESELC